MNTQGELSRSRREKRDSLDEKFFRKQSCLSCKRKKKLRGGGSGLEKKQHLKNVHIGGGYEKPRRPCIIRPLTQKENFRRISLVKSPFNGGDSAATKRQHRPRKRSLNYTEGSEI